jgi:hypothetical protein
MRVRRHTKERHAGDLATAWINFELGQLDMLTFFYIRNGERLYRMNCELEFGELIFPPKDEFLGEPTMAKIRGESVESFMTVREYEQRQREQAERRVKAAAWLEENPFKKWRKAKLAEIDAECADAIARAKEKRDKTIADVRAEGERIIAEAAAKGRPSTFNIERHVKYKTEEADSGLEHSVEWAERDRKRRRKNDADEYDWQRANPHYMDKHHAIEQQGYEPFDKTSVFFDESREKINKQVKHWNRIALIIQGLFDRSEVFHPHPPVTLATPNGFAAAVELVYDGSHALEPGPAPNFDAYRRVGLTLLKKGSVTIGQSRVWLAREREREYSRRRYGDRDMSAWWTPSGDDGPGFVARVADWRRGPRQAVYRWLRGKRRSYGSDRVVRSRIEVEDKELFNVSEYKPGDYLQFFNDPRTRRQYLRWAPLLLTAEEYYAGNVKVQEPETKPPENPKEDRDVEFDVAVDESEDDDAEENES